MLVLVWAIEQLLIHNHPGIQNEHGMSWSYAANHAKHEAVGRDVLCFGDSLMKNGLLPRVITHETGRSCYNLAVFGGPAPSSYFLFRRALDAGARPSAVIVDFINGFLAQGPATTVRTFPWADLVNFRESAELCWTARDPDLFARITLARLFPSIKNRFEIRNFICMRLRGEQSPSIGHQLLLARNWNKNEGAMVQACFPYKDETPLPRGRRAAGDWTCDPTNETYLDQFLTLAANHRIQVYWLMPPITPVYQATLDLTGNEDRARTFMRERLRRFPDLIVIDGQHAGYENPAFLDMVHLHRQGASALSAALAEVLRQPPRDPRPESRWVALPPYRERTIEVSLEDVFQSKEALAMKFRAKERLRK